jgi:hypothetical protein
MTLCGTTWETCYSESWLSRDMTAAYVLHRISVGSFSPACTPWRYFFTEFSLASWYVSWNLWTAVVFYRCKSWSFVALRGDDADIFFDVQVEWVMYLEEFPIRHQFHPVFLGWNMSFLCALTMCDVTCCWKPFLLLVSCCLVSDSCVRKLLSEFIWHLIGTACSKYIIQNMCCHDVVRIMTAGDFIENLKHMWVGLTWYIIDLFGND